MRIQKIHFHAKTTSAKHYIYMGVGARDLYIPHIALDILRFAVLFLMNACLKEFYNTFPAALISVWNT